MSQDSLRAEVTRLRELYESACLIAEKRRQEIELLRARICTIFDAGPGLLTDVKLMAINATQNERIVELEAELAEVKATLLAANEAMLARMPEGKL